MPRHNLVTAPLQSGGNSGYNTQCHKRQYDNQQEVQISVCFFL